MSLLRIATISNHDILIPHRIINMFIRRRSFSRHPSTLASPIQSNSHILKPINLHITLTRTRPQFKDLQIAPQSSPSLTRVTARPLRVTRTTLRKRNRKATRRLRHTTIIRRRRRHILHIMRPTNITRSTATKQLPPVSHTKSDLTYYTSILTHYATHYSRGLLQFPHRMPQTQST